MRYALWIITGLLTCTVAWADEPAPGEFSRRTPVVVAIEKAGPAVVNIATEKVVVMRGSSAIPPRGTSDDDWLNEFWRAFPQQHEVKARSLGSGVIIDRRGYIITNAHVVQRASSIQVSLMDKSVYKGRLISVDPTLDLAIVKIDGKNDFPAVRMGNSSDLLTGETVIAVGNPFGYAHTVTTGVLSAKDRSIRVSEDVVLRGLLQTDASINPGNSGGALLDINGKLIGICEAVRSQAEGIGFAISVDTVKSAMVGLLDFRRIRKTWLGVGLEPVRRVDTGERVGLRIKELEAGGPAEKAGLRVMDVITSLSGEPMLDVAAFEIQVLEKNAGDILDFKILREGVAKDVAVTLGKLPVPDATELIRRRLGLTVEVLNEADAVAEGLTHGGLRITSVAPRSPAGDAGLKTGDVIQLFGNYRISQPEDLGGLLGSLPANARAMVTLVRKGYNYYTWLQVR